MGALFVYSVITKEVAEVEFRRTESGIDSGEVLVKHSHKPKIQVLFYNVCGVKMENWFRGKMRSAKANTHFNETPHQPYSTNHPTLVRNNCRGISLKFPDTAW